MSPAAILGGALLLFVSCSSRAPEELASTWTPAPHVPTPRRFSGVTFVNSRIDTSPASPVEITGPAALVGSLVLGDGGLRIRASPGGPNDPGEGVLVQGGAVAE